MIFYLTKRSREEYLQILRKSISLNLAIAIFGIMIFREMFEVSNANVVIKDLIISAHIPTILMVILIPLILGVLTGYNLGSVALSYPILVPFFSADISLINLVGFSSLIFILFIMCSGVSSLGYVVYSLFLCNNSVI